MADGTENMLRVWHRFGSCSFEYVLAWIVIVCVCRVEAVS